jgi:hypothetical protein
MLNTNLRTQASSPDFREVPLAELLVMSDAIRDEMLRCLRRLLSKGEQAAPIPATSFQSAI